jgi:hypothetical protein
MYKMTSCPQEVAGLASVRSDCKELEHFSIGLISAGEVKENAAITWNGLKLCSVVVSCYTIESTVVEIAPGI